MAEARNTPGPGQPLFVSGDLDGFFGLAIDNLIQFLLILGLCSGVLGFPMELLLRSVLPAAALSMVVGNLYYARQAQRVAASEGRDDVTALPYGINTVSLFAFVFLVMLPVKLAALDSGQGEVEAALTAWRVGLAACFLSGVIELLGAPFADWVRRVTPRAALLSTLSGIAISFIAIDFAVRSFEMPLIALLPLSVILTTYFSGIRLPLRIPGGAWALGLGTLAAWGATLVPGVSTPVSAGALSGATDNLGFYPPLPVLSDLIAGLGHELTARFLVPVIVPMGLFNVLGSLQNLESAEAAGDRYPSAPCMTINGLGSLAAAAFGSCFPTTIYIGHPGWKGLGARSGYSVLNAVFFGLVALLGLSHAISAVIPIEAGMAIVLWIGIVITAQAFQATPDRHAPAVALGLFPAIAGWGVLVLSQTLGAANLATGDFGLAARVLAAPGAFAGAGMHLDGLVALSQGFMLTCLVWSAASASLIDRDFGSATRFMTLGALLSFFGFMHAGHLSPSGGIYEIGWGSGGRFAVGYLLSAVFFALTGLWARRSGQLADKHSEATGH
ncbi:MAG: NCS2 family permease [Myxococcales bacterium]|nr:NCS2 family permease [Myxococcales bacterium]